MLAVPTSKGTCMARADAHALRRWVVSGLEHAASLLGDSAGGVLSWLALTTTSRDWGVDIHGRLAMPAAPPHTTQLRRRSRLQCGPSSWARWTCFGGSSRWRRAASAAPRAAVDRWAAASSSSRRRRGSCVQDDDMHGLLAQPVPLPLPGHSLLLCSPQCYAHIFQQFCATRSLLST